MKESYGNDGSDGKPGKPTPGFPPFFPQILGNLADDARFPTFPQLRRRMFCWNERTQKQKEIEGRLHKILDTAARRGQYKVTQYPKSLDSAPAKSLIH